jgi:molecular chaperone DnaK
MTDKIFGIDLGTTNSEIACLIDGRPQVLTIEDGRKYLPSVVGIGPSGDILTGFAARNQRAVYPENTVVSIKRRMGSGKRVKMGERFYTPAEISSHILKALKEAAERETGLPVQKVVITVPAYFSDLQRKDTIQAGELAGLEVVRIINEPTAAALAYGCREEQREKIMVYDFGGGTFDVSLIDVEEGVLEVMASDGNTHLGGDDLDRLLLELFLSHFSAEVRSAKDLRLQARLRNAAEAAKIRLSTETRVQVQEEFLTSLKGKPVNLELEVSRAQFEERIRAELDRTFDLVQAVLQSAKTKAEDISKLLLVGGSTYIPMIFDTLSGRLGFEVHREVDPTYCVAIGAAIQGAIISGEHLDTILVDVNTHSLGIRTLIFLPGAQENDDHYSIIINRNTPIPSSMTRTYHTAMDNQPEAQIDVYQGENPTASKNTLVGSFVLEDLPPNLPEGSEIEVSFHYNLNGIVEVSALEPGSGRHKQLQVDVNRAAAGGGDKKTPSQHRAKGDAEPGSARRGAAGRGAAGRGG